MNKDPSMDLFEFAAATSAAADAPLAERMRPATLDDVTGQSHLTGEGGLIRNALKTGRVFSMILWGPPGCGKTTLAGILAAETQSHFVQISAVLSGVKEVRAVIEEAKKIRQIRRKQTLLFVDEIHRFNKSQQDAFLPHVESGLITLIGATTENPSFEVIAPLLSRCRVVTLKPLDEAAVEAVIDRALTEPERGLGRLKLTIDPAARAHLVRIADGDARAALNSLEVAAHIARSDGRDVIDPETIERAMLKGALRYDKSGEEHYNLISAFHKSLRGSDPDAALYWLARMLSAGEDPIYVARRMVRFASEDVGNADPYALQVAMNATEAYRFLGSPEGDLALAHAAAYLATAPKSNAVYAAYNDALKTATEAGSLPVPLHIRNAPTGLMKELGYGKDYRYAHDFPEGFVPQEYLPDALRGRIFYHPSGRGYEKTIKQRLDRWRELKNTPSK